MKAFRRIYLLLGPDEEGPRLAFRWLEEILPQLALSSSLYLGSASLPGSLRQIQELLEALAGFLKKHPLLRLSLHLCHPAPAAEAAQIRASYRALERLGHQFNLEGYLHQEVPRLLLLPVLKVGPEDGPLGGLLSFLRGLFLIPSLYLPPARLPEGELAGAERLYWGRQEGEDVAQALLRLADYALLDDCLLGLESGVKPTGACRHSLVISEPDGAIYPCPGACRRGAAVSLLSGCEASLEAMERRGECLRCRAEVAGSFLGSPEAASEAERLGALLYSLGNLQLERGDYAAATGSLEKALGLVGAAQKGHVNFRLGLGYLNLGRHGLALERLGEAAGTYGGQYYFPFYTGLCRLGKGEPGLALEDFSRALELGPPGEDRAQILLYAGSCLNSLGSYREAAASLEEARTIAGPTKEICNGLGFSYFKLKEFDSAIANLREAVRLDPSSAIDYASLGSNLREKGEIGEAVKMYEKALELDPGLEFARSRLAELRRRQGQK